MKSLPRLKAKKKQPEELPQGLGAAELDGAAPISPEGQAFVEEVSALAEEVWEEGSGVLPALAAPPPPGKTRYIKRISIGFTIAGVGIFVLLAMVLMLSVSANGVFGLRFAIEPTDAMAPEIPRGSLLVTVSRSAGKIEEGDVITFYASTRDTDTRLTRYVYERSGSEEDYRFRTKRPGDVAPDSITINPTMILGVKLFSVPYAGYVISFLDTYAGGFAGVAAALCIAAVLLRMWLGSGAPRRPTRKERNHAATSLL